MRTCTKYVNLSETQELDMHTKLATCSAGPHNLSTMMWTK